MQLRKSLSKKIFRGGTVMSDDFNQDQDGYEPIKKKAFFRTGFIKSIVIWILMFLIIIFIGVVTVKSTPKTDEGANVNTSTTQPSSTTEPTSTPSVVVDTDYGMYKGKVFKVNETINTNPNFTVTLNQVLVGDQDFGKASEGTWLNKSNSDEKMSEAKFAIVDYTIKAKKDLDLKSMNFDITWSGGPSNGGLYSPGGTNALGAERFGFYPLYSSMKVNAGESKEIKVKYVFTNQVLSGDKIYFQFEVNYNYDERVEFDITKIVK